MTYYSDSVPQFNYTYNVHSAEKKMYSLHCLRVVSSTQICLENISTYTSIIKEFTTLHLNFNNTADLWSFAIYDHVKSD